jgi:glycosyltransferase involved in cell wall biosynthesis
MHLLFIVRYNPFASTGGTEIFAGNLAKELIKKGHKIDIVYGNDSKTPYFQNSSVGAGLFPVALINIPYLRAYIFQHKSYACIKKLLNEQKIEAIIAFGAGTFPFFCFKKVYQKSDDVPMVYYAMDTMIMEFERSKLSKKGLLDNTITRFRYRELIKSDKASCVYANLILASSEDTSNNLASTYRIPYEKIKILYEGIPDDYADEIPSIEPSVPTFLHVGGGPRKGTAIFLKALEMLEKKYSVNAKAVITRARSLDVMEAKKLSLLVDTYDYVSINELKKLYSSCTAIISPSFSEGFCLPIIEAATFGKPAIITNVGSLPELIKDGYNGFVIPVDDVPSLANKMYQLSVDHTRRENLSKMAKLTSKQFTISSTAKCLISALERYLSLIKAEKSMC